MPNYTTAGGFLLVLAIVLPVAGALFSLMLGGRRAERVVFVLMPAGLAVALAIAIGVWRSRNVLQYFVGAGTRHSAWHFERTGFLRPCWWPRRFWSAAWGCSCEVSSPSRGRAKPTRRSYFGHCCKRSG